MNEYTKFWVVWNENNRAPTVKHWNILEASSEAERLARKHEGQIFHVLEYVNSCWKKDIIWAINNEDYEDC